MSRVTLWIKIVLCMSTFILGLQYDYHLFCKDSRVGWLEQLSERKLGRADTTPENRTQQKRISGI